jgi:universal stress protein E
MSQYQRLLLIADPNMLHHQALQRAMALAQASGAALHIAAFVAALPVFDENFEQVPWQSLLNQRRQWLQEQTADLASQGITVTIEVVFSDDPLEEILVHVAQMQPDMLIKDVQHVAALKRAFITPLDCHLLRECPVPVHLVSSVAQPLPHRVVAAVDLSSPETQLMAINEQIIRAANGLALQCNAELHLLHVYDLAPVVFWDGAAGAAAWSADFIADLHASLLKAFTQLAEHFGVPAERRHFVRGTPLRAIADFARQQHSDVLVMGTRHHRGLSSPLLGSTAEYLLYQAPCNILAVKPAADTE